MRAVSFRRSFAKAISYRIVIMTLDFTTIYIFTGAIQVAAGFMIVSNIYTSIAYLVTRKALGENPVGRRRKVTHPRSMSPPATRRAGFASGPSRVLFVRSVKRSPPLGKIAARAPPFGLPPQEVSLDSYRGLAYVQAALGTRMMRVLTESRFQTCRRFKRRPRAEQASRTAFEGISHELSSFARPRRGQTSRG